MVITSASLYLPVATSTRLVMVVTVSMALEVTISVIDSNSPQLVLEVKASSRPDRFAIFLPVRITVEPLMQMVTLTHGV